MTDFTSRGEGIDILAPGEKIWSYGAFAGLQTLDGTSIATAHVTGAAALLLERYPAAAGVFRGRSADLQKRRQHHEPDDHIYGDDRPHS